MTIEDITYCSQNPNSSQKKRIVTPKLRTKGRLEKFAFFGSADLPETDPLYTEAYTIAKNLAEKGKTIINGGGPGIMKASTEGAESINGKTLSITFYPKDMPYFEGRDQLNIVDKELRTTNYIERMAGLLSEADAFIIFRGGTGTLSEWSTAWLIAHLYYDQAKPLFLYGDFWHDFMKSVDTHFLIGQEEKEVYKIVANQSELFDAIQATEKNFAEKH